jgi:hypothetical protein
MFSRCSSSALYDLRKVPTSHSPLQMKFPSWQYTSLNWDDPANIVDEDQLHFMMPLTCASLFFLNDDCGSFRGSTSSSRLAGLLFKHQIEAPALHLDRDTNAIHDCARRNIEMHLPSRISQTTGDPQRDGGGLSKSHRIPKGR